MDRPWEAFDRARRVLRGRDDLVGWKSADLPSVSALTKTRQAGQGSAAHGGCCASLGHKFGFGNTLDQTLLKVLGCKERGHKSQGPLVHATGKGWVKEHKGQYYDALHVKNGIVKICLVESQGGIAPPTKRIIFNFAKEVGSPSAVDRTDYGTASGSARGFAQHHSQQLSRAAFRSRCTSLPGRGAPFYSRATPP